jgi:hypothetical protein
MCGNRYSKRDAASVGRASSRAVGPKSLTCMAGPGAPDSASQLLPPHGRDGRVNRPGGGTPRQRETDRREIELCGSKVVLDSAGTGPMIKQVFYKDGAIMKFSNTLLSQLPRILIVIPVLLSTSTCVSQRPSTVEMVGPQSTTEAVAVGVETAPGDPLATGRPDARAAMRPGETPRPPRPTPRPCPNPPECGPAGGGTHCPPHCTSTDPQ